MVNGACQPSCPVKTYGNETARACIDCPDECSECLSPTSCQACVDGYRISPLGDSSCVCVFGFMSPTSIQCIAKCPDGFYGNSTTYKCTACNSNCAICSGGAKSQCSKCKPGFFIYGFLCEDFCPTGFFQNSTENRCD
jgi:proprotein convertase subtilisin/kexin type 5